MDDARRTVPGWSRRDVARLGASLVLGATSAARAMDGTARVLRFVPQADLAVLDPVWTTATVTNVHALLVFDTLYGLDAAYRPRPQMIEGERVEGDGRDWTLVLRPGLLFHDGSPVRAADVVASVRRWGARDLFGQEVLAAAEEIAAPDERTVRFRFRKPFPHLSAALGKVAPSMCAIMPERLAASAAAPVTEMVGSGPYRFLAEEWRPGSRAAYARFEGYRPRPDGEASRTAGPKRTAFDRIEWHVITDAGTAAAALRAGEVDWIESASPDLLPFLERDRAVSARFVDERYGYLLRLNHLHPPFDDPRLRRALLPALDQEAFMRAAFGDGAAGWRAGTGFFLSGSPMASEAGLAALTGPRAPDEARAALRAAGYGGERVVLLQPEDLRSLKALTEVAADMLRRVGMTVEVQAMDWGTLLRRRASREPIAKGGWSAFVSGSAATLDPSSHVALRGNGAGAWFGWPDSPELERLRAAWFAARDETEHRAIGRAMQEEAFRVVPYLPLGEARRFTAHRADLDGFPVGTASVFGVTRR